MNWLAQCFGAGWQGDAMVVAFLVLFGWILRILYRVNKSVTNDLDFSDWLKGPDGKASWNKGAAIGGFVTGTFCMVYVTIMGKLPDGYTTFFLAYFVVVIGNPAAFDLLRRWRPLPSDQPDKE